MKIRNGFVSNSSSSSFVVIGVKVDVQQLKAKDLESSKYLVFTENYLCEGEDVFQIEDEKMLKFVKNHSNLKTKTCIRAFKVFYDDKEFTLSKKDFEGEDLITVMNTTKDDCSSCSIQALKENYSEDS